MDKSTSSSHLQKATSKLRELNPTTTTLEVLTPTASQSMILPTIDTPRPSETSGGNVYLKFIEAAMAKVSPTGKMSEIFSQLANQFKEKEEILTPNPKELPTDLMTPIETSVAQTLEEQIPGSTNFYRGNSAAPNPGPEEGEEVETEEQGNHQGKGCSGKGRDEAEIPKEEAMPDQLKERLVKGRHEVIALEEDESEDGKENLSQRATRRNLRRRRRLNEEDPKGQINEAATLAVTKLEVAEQRRKGKQIATISREVKRRSTSQGVIQEHAEDLNTPLHQSDEEQEVEAMETSESEGVYEKLRVTIDHKLQEAMVYFKDPMKRKNCAGR